MPPHDFRYTAQSIAELTDRLIDKARKVEDKVATLKPEECTFESVVLPLSHDEDAFESASDPAIFMQSVSTDKSVRDAATEASKKISVGLSLPTNVLSLIMCRYAGFRYRKLYEEGYL